MLDGGRQVIPQLVALCGHSGGFLGLLIELGLDRCLVCHHVTQRLGFKVGYCQWPSAIPPTDADDQDQHGQYRPRPFCIFAGTLDIRFGH